MNLSERIRQHFEDSVSVKLAALERLEAPLHDAINLLVAALGNNNKLLICGNGGSAADSQHFAAELVGRLERERPELAAISLATDIAILTAIGNDYSFEDIFAKQVRALGQPNDVLVAISTSGNSGNVVAAVTVAQQRGMRVLALTGNAGGLIGTLLRTDDVHLCVPAERTMRIQEVHILLIHCLCDGIDAILLGDDKGASE